MEGIEIRVTKKQKIMSIDINVCRYENKKGYSIYLSKETLENDMELLQAGNGCKQHNDYIKDKYNDVKHKK